MVPLSTIHRLLTEIAECASSGKELLLLLLLIAATASYGQIPAPAATPPPQAPPKTWIDELTGHRVTRLTDEPNSVGLYFDENAYTPDGLDMIYTSPKGIYDLNLSTLKSELLVAGQLSDIVVGTKERRVFFTRKINVTKIDPEAYAVNIDTKQVTHVAALPYRAFLTTVNADETLLAGVYTEGTAPDFGQYKAEALADVMRQQIAHPFDPGELNKAIAKANADATEKRLASQTPQDIFTVNLKTGEIKVILKGTDWLDHIQFSPTDPNLILYAHEGPSLEVDRVWTIHADGSHNQLMQKRTDPAGIATHEFWGHDGKTIWFDLQKSRGEDFTLAGIEVATGNPVAYRLKKEEASMHYNVSFDGSLFCGDGNLTTHGEIGVNGHRTLDRAWIELLRPSPDGTFHSTRLAHIPDNNYSLSEPNPRFSPDKKLVIFTSNMFGKNYIFAVEVAKAPAALGAGE